MTHLRSVSMALENLKHGLVKANSNASLSNVNLFNVFAFVSILSDGPIVVNFSLKYFLKFLDGQSADPSVRGSAQFDLDGQGLTFDLFKNPVVLCMLWNSLRYLLAGF